MDKPLFDIHGKPVEGADDKRKNRRFHVCLQVVYHGHSTECCADFILNISMNGVFILTRDPLPVGSALTMRFYIPPEEKSLSDFEGVVAGVNKDDPRFPKGMHVKFTACTPQELKRLEEFVEERRHLVDLED